MTPRPVRLLLLIMRPTVSQLLAAVTIVGVGAWLAVNTPDDFDQSFALVMLLQMFGAATGFVHWARRGYFDPILVFPHRRARAVVAHLAVSAAPGVVVWFVVVATDIILRSGHASTGLTIAGLTAIAWVSLATWAVSLVLPRYSGGLIWLFIFVLLAARHKLQALEPIFLDQTSAGRLLKAAGAALVAPPLLVAHPADASRAMLLLLALACVAVLAIGTSVVMRLDVPLSEPS